MPIPSAVHLSHQSPGDVIALMIAKSTRTAGPTNRNFTARTVLDIIMIALILSLCACGREAQGIIQASWNWPFDRKDMEIYGKTGSVLVPRSDLVRVRTGNDAEHEEPAASLTGALGDPLSYLTAVVRGEVRPSGLSSLEVNMIVTEILDAARQSDRTGKRIDLPVKPGGERKHRAPE